MPKYTATNMINSNLPMWDSFEAIFFMVAGFSVGVVLGILFPSIWRSFRRSFRKSAHYAPKPDEWDEHLNSKIKILSEDNAEHGLNINSKFLYVYVFEAFTAARYYFQIGEVRKAISLYIEILTFEHVSKQDTNRALFELSQIYFSIGLYGRSFDTAFELLNRKPHNNQILLHILKICACNFATDKINLILNIYKGSPDAHVRRSIAHLICCSSETFLEKKEIIKAIDTARLSVKWDRTSGRALMMLWETTSVQFWLKNKNDYKVKWLSFAADLEALSQIFLNSKISPASCALYLSSLIEALLFLPNSIDNYKQVEKEFHATFNWERLSSILKKKLLQSIFYAIILLQKKSALSSHENFNEVLSIITQNQHDKIINFLNYSLTYESYIFFSFLAHECSQCHTLYPRFSWQCSNCNLEESLFPANKPFIEAVS